MAERNISISNIFSNAKFKDSKLDPRLVPHLQKVKAIGKKTWES